jgi:hypothetical protein
MPEVVFGENVIALDEENGRFSINGDHVTLTMLQAEQLASLLLNWAAKRHAMPDSKGRYPDAPSVN